MFKIKKHNKWVLKMLTVRLKYYSYFSNSKPNKDKIPNGMFEKDKP